MKLTKEVLRKIIKEELTQASALRGGKPSESPAQGLGANLGIELGKLISRLVRDPSVTSKIVEKLAAEEYAQEYATGGFANDPDGPDGTNAIIDSAMKYLTRELHATVKDVVIDLQNELGL